MPTDKWKQDNPKVSGHIPKELKSQLDQFIKDQGLRGTSEALRIILENHFSQSELRTSSQLKTESYKPVINLLEDRLEAAESLLKEHSAIIKRFKTSPKSQEKHPKVLNSSDNSHPKSSQPVTNRSQITIFNGWLTTGEAYGELQNRGYERSLGTFRRTLRNSGVTEELQDLGLIADFKLRNQANPKDNSVRWLKLN